MLVKVCGLNNAENAEKIAKLDVQFTGHIFHPQSPRHNAESKALHHQENVKRVGVFVNQPLAIIQQKINEWQLSVVQLHGTESPEFAREIKELGLEVWKVLHLKSENVNWNLYKSYIPFVNMFLLDYKSESMGGAGKKFDWGLLNTYPFQKPVMLAGGIGPKDANTLKTLFTKHSFLKGVDLNSRFESQAGMKNIELLQQFLQDLK